MKKAIIQILFLIILPFFVEAQIKSSQDILFEAINHRNEYNIFSVDIFYEIKNIGELKPVIRECTINKILDDSFYMKRKLIGGKGVTYIVESKDSLTHIESNAFSSTFTIDQFYRKQIGRTMGRNSVHIKRMLGQYLDSSMVTNLLPKVKDTLVFGVPCWALYLSPYNTPVSRVIQNIYFISKIDCFFRGFKQVEIYDKFDTTVIFSFITKMDFDKSNILENMRLQNQEIHSIVNKFAQIPTITFNIDTNLYNGKIEGFNALNILNQDTFYLNFTKGKYLLDFWFIGCYPCMKSFPYLDSLENKYKPKGVQFIKLNPLDSKDPEKVIRYSKLHTIEKENYLISRSLCSNFSVISYPSFIFIEDGKIIKSYTGFDESVNEELKKYLEIWTAK